MTRLAQQENGVLNEFISGRDLAGYHIYCNVSDCLRPHLVICSDPAERVPSHGTTKKPHLFEMYTVQYRNILCAFHFLSHCSKSHSPCYTSRQFFSIPILIWLKCDQVFNTKRSSGSQRLMICCSSRSFMLVWPCKEDRNGPKGTLPAQRVLWLAYNRIKGSVPAPAVQPRVGNMV